MQSIDSTGISYTAFDIPYTTFILFVVFVAYPGTNVKDGRLSGLVLRMTWKTRVEQRGDNPKVRLFSHGASFSSAPGSDDAALTVVPEDAIRRVKDATEIGVFGEGAAANWSVTSSVGKKGRHYRTGDTIPGISDAFPVSRRPYARHIRKTHIASPIATHRVSCTFQSLPPTAHATSPLRKPTVEWQSGVSLFRLIQEAVS